MISDKLAMWIESIVKQFLDSPENTLMDRNNEKAWAEPLVGFSSGADSLYQFYKRDIGEFYLTLLEMFTYSFSNLDVTSDQLTVISWILPHTEATKREHRLQTRYPTERWARARIYGEKVNDKLRMHAVTAIQKAGYDAVAPVTSPFWKRENSRKYYYASRWSERHTAYAAGLGTFGLCDGLITPKGKAMRCGSVIAKIQIPPSKRQYKNHHAYCLFHMKGTCGECINRCPARALSKKGHDKEKCKRYLDITKEYVRSNYKFEGYGCGLCQTGVPCESEIPSELK